MASIDWVGTGTSCSIAKLPHHSTLSSAEYRSQCPRSSNCPSFERNARARRHVLAAHDTGFSALSDEKDAFESSAALVRSKAACLASLVLRLICDGSLVGQRPSESRKRIPVGVRVPRDDSSIHSASPVFVLK